MDKKYKVSVYNTVTKEYETIEVSREIYDVYRRTEWNIKNKNKSFYKHEIQFSSLKGSMDGAYENFDEFIDGDNTPEKIVINQLIAEKLSELLIQLSNKEQDLLNLLFVENKSERECAEIFSISQKNINKNKKIILDKLHKLLEKINFRGIKIQLSSPIQVRKA